MTVMLFKVLLSAACFVDHAFGEILLAHCFFFISLSFVFYLVLCLHSFLVLYMYLVLYFSVFLTKKREEEKLTMFMHPCHNDLTSC